MFQPKAFALGVVAAVALTGAAAAADLLPPPPLPEPPAPVVDMGGWYIRGDAGIGFNGNPDLTTAPDALAGGQASGYLSNTATEGYFNPSLSESAIADIGFGYQVNSWFRADVTGELRGGATLQGLEVLNDSKFPGAGATYNAAQFGDFYRANVASYLLMFNAYADLGTWYGVTPFVGAGVGTSYNRIYGGTDTGYASFANTTTNTSANAATGGYFDNAGHFDLAFALMAGLDFNVTRNLKLELGYRFIDYGKFTSGNSHCAMGANGNGQNFGGCSAYHLATRDLTANDFRIGLRYYLDAPAPAPDIPLVRKY